MVATISELTEELVARVKTTNSVGERGYSVFNVEELEIIGGSLGFPLAGIMYEGATPIEHSVQSKTNSTKSTSIVTLHFLLVVGVHYKYASDVDAKPAATNLLDEVRQVVLGYRGVNTRPWRYTGEIPLQSELEGVILYGQMWETDIPVIGNSPN